MIICKQPNDSDHQLNTNIICNKCARDEWDERIIKTVEKDIREQKKQMNFYIGLFVFLLILNTFDIYSIKKTFLTGFNLGILFIYFFTVIGTVMNFIEKNRNAKTFIEDIKNTKL